MHTTAVLQHNFVAVPGIVELSSTMETQTSMPLQDSTVSNSISSFPNLNSTPNSELHAIISDNCNAEWSRDTITPPYFPPGHQFSFGGNQFLNSFDQSQQNSVSVTDFDEPIKQQQSISRDSLNQLQMPNFLNNPASVTGFPMPAANNSMLLSFLCNFQDSARLHSDDETLSGQSYGVTANVQLHQSTSSGCHLETRSSETGESSSGGEDRSIEVGGSGNNGEDSQLRRSASDRERSRMRQMNQAFDALRKILDHKKQPGKRLSKIQALRFAIQYINELEDVLMDAGGGLDEEFGAFSNSSAFANGFWTQMSQFRQLPLKQEPVDCSYNMSLSNTGCFDGLTSNTGQWINQRNAPVPMLKTYLETMETGNQQQFSQQTPTLDDLYF